MSDSTAKNGRIDMVATAACLGALCCWSLGPIFIAHLTEYVGSWTQNALRYTVACLFWLPALLYFMHQGRFDRRTWRHAVLPSVANIAMQSLWAATFYYMGPAFAVLLSKTSVLWVAAFSLLFFADERPLAKSGRFWGGLALAVTGVFGVLYFREDFATAGTITGVGIALACAFMWAVYTISVKIAFREIDSRSGFAVISIYTVIGLWIGVFIFGRPSACAAMPFFAWISLVISGLTESPRLPWGMCSTTRPSSVLGLPFRAWSSWPSLSSFSASPALFSRSVSTASNCSSDCSCSAGRPCPFVPRDTSKAIDRVRRDASMAHFSG